MKRRLSPAALSAGIPAAAVARLFYGLMVEAKDLHNGAWLSVLLGAILAMPVILLAGRCLNGGRAGALKLALLALLSMDAAAVMEGMAYSESFIAFDHVPVVVLMLPLALALGRSLAVGGDAVGAAARIWMWAFLPLLLMVIAMQLPYYRPGWLCPVLGYGVGGVLLWSLRAAGWLAMISAAGMAVSDGEMTFVRVRRGLMLSAVAAALLIVLRLMMTPSMEPAAMTRGLRIDTLLTNGRAPLYLQLPMIVMWFVGLLHLLCFEGCLALTLLRDIAPSWHSRVRGGLVLLAVIAGALFLPGFQMGAWGMALVALTSVAGLRPVRKGEAA